MKDRYPTDLPARREKENMTEPQEEFIDDGPPSESKNGPPEKEKESPNQPPSP